MDWRERPAADFVVLIFKRTAAEAPQVATSEPMTNPSKRKKVAIHTSLKVCHFAFQILHFAMPSSNSSTLTPLVWIALEEIGLDFSTSTPLDWIGFFNFDINWIGSDNNRREKRERRIKETRTRTSRTSRAHQHKNMRMKFAQLQIALCGATITHQTPRNEPHKKNEAHVDNDNRTSTSEQSIPNQAVSQAKAWTLNTAIKHQSAIKDHSEPSCIASHCHPTLEPSTTLMTTSEQIQIATALE